MNLSWIDWTIVVASIVLIRLVSWSSRSLMKGVAGFLSANRLAGRYLLTIAGEMGNFGVITLVGGWQVFMSAGFPSLWWGFMSAPLGIIFTMTGWVFYRLRETRALTVGQFLEMRYSRKFRAFAGFLCWLSGIINFGIFPAIAARFLIYFCGLPDQFAIPGTHLVLGTYPVIMAADLGLALVFVNSGGQISVMITECAQGMIACFAYLAIAIAAILLIPWGHALTALHTASAESSMLNPYHTAQVADFNVWYYVISIFISTYGYKTWLGGQGFMTSARNPHEQRMGGLIATWRSAPLTLMSLVLPLTAFTVMKLPEYSHLMATVNGTISHIDNKAVQNEMLVPVILAHLLPVGIKGLLVMVALFLSFTCHDTYLHSWGSIFVQDVVMPLRKKPFEPEEHIKWLRWSIFSVAVFAFLFSLLYQETDMIYFFFAITGTIWLAGAGVVMIGGLYSRFGTSAAAYVSMIAGAVFGVTGLILPKIWEAHHTTKFPINGQWQAFLSDLVSIALFVVVSLATGGRRNPFNLEKMLHRGIYAVDPHEHEVKSELRSRWQEMLGLGKEFSTGDKIIAIATSVWSLVWWVVFIVVSTLHFGFNLVPDRFWDTFWHFYILTLLVQSVPVVIWFTVGGVMDVRLLLATLRTATVNPEDDGRVLDMEPLAHLALDTVEEKVLDR